MSRKYNFLFVILFGAGILQLSASATTEEYERYISTRSFEKPFDIVDYLLQQCPRNISIDPAIIKYSETCLEETMNEETVVKFLLGVMNKKYQEISQKACLMWPLIRKCLGGVISYLEGCHHRSYYGEVAEKLVEYFCSTGEREGSFNNAADFMVAGGITCLNRAKIRHCLAISLDQNISFCTMMEKIRKCLLSTFEKCSSPKPWEIVSHGLDHLAVNFNCTISSTVVGKAHA